MWSIDFVMAYTQADVKTDIFMQLPSGTTIQGVDPNKHLLKLQKNLYGLKDGQVTWNQHIKTGLLSRGFHQSKVDPCLSSRELSFSSYMLMLLPFFRPTLRQSTVRSCPSSNLLTSLMKAIYKTTWEHTLPSTQMALLNSNKRGQLTIVWSFLAWVLHPKT